MLDENSTKEFVIAKILDNLRAQPETDANLLEILAKHIVNVVPCRDPVTNAVLEIEQLAQARGNPPHQ